jgi:hypothetical protein
MSGSITGALILILLDEKTMRFFLKQKKCNVTSEAGAFATIGRRWRRHAEESDTLRKANPSPQLKLYQSY